MRFLGVLRRTLKERRTRSWRVCEGRFPSGKTASEGWMGRRYALLERKEEFEPKV